MSVPYYQINSFSSEPFAGNPAGVCFLDAFPTNLILQKVAAENGHSQTAFVVQRGDGEFDLRWFTPRIEDDLCGHATLAAAYALALRNHLVWPVRFHTRSGVLTVTREDELFEMDFPVWSSQPCDAPDKLLPALGLTDGRVLKSPRDYLVVLDASDHVRVLKPNLTELAAIEMGMGGVIVTAAGTDGIDYVSRFFAPSVGIDEDPVTGSINCALAPYWGARLGKRELQVRQISGRGGELRCTLNNDRVRIAGRACLYMHGTLNVSV